MSSSEIKTMLRNFYPFAKERMGFDRVPKFRFLTDPQNAVDPLGKTAFYESDTDTVSVYTDNRHPKDILRSISHELVHHTQNCRGQLSDISSAGEQGYAQNDLHLREMERQAYEVGNMTFRDWEDGYKMSKESNLDEATIGTQNFDQLEQVGSQWKQAISTKQGVDEAEEAFVDVADKFLVPEMEALGFQSEAAYSIRSKRTLEFATADGRDIEAEIAPTSEGWYVQVYSFQEEEELDKQQKVPDLRTAIEFIRKVADPENADGPRAGEDPSQMELPLNEQEEPFPVGSRVTHKAKSSLGVGTVIKMGKSPMERRIEWKESFRKAQTTTEKITMLSDASVKEIKMIEKLTKSIIKNLQRQGTISLSEELGDPEKEGEATRQHMARGAKADQDRKEKRSSQKQAVQDFINSEPDMSSLTSKQFKRGDGTPYTGHQLPIPDLLSPQDAAQMIASHQPLMDYVQKNIKGEDSVSGAGGEAIGGKELLSALDFELKAGDAARSEEGGHDVSEQNTKKNTIKENANMSNGIKGGFDQRLRNMVGEQIKAALENALLSEEEDAEEGSDEVSVDVDVDVDDGNEEEMDEGFLSRAKARAGGLKGAAKGLAKGGIKGMKAGYAGGKAASSLGKTSSSLYSTLRSLKKDAVALDIDELPQVADALSNLEKSVQSLQGAAEELGNKKKEKANEEVELTLEDRIKEAVRGALAPAPLSLEEKIKNAIQGALLQEDDDKDDDDDGDDEKQTPEERAEDIKGKGESVASELEDTPDDEKDDVLRALRKDEEKNEGYKPTSYNRDEDDKELNEQDFEYATDPQQEIVSLLKEPPAELNAVPADNGAPSVHKGDLITHLENKHGAEAIGTFEGTLEDLIGDGFVVSEGDELSLRYPDNPLGKGVNEGCSRLAQAGRRELNVRHNRLFETLKKKWIK